VNALRAQQNRDLGLPVKKPLLKINEKTIQADDLRKVQAKVHAEMEAESLRLQASGEALILSFNYNVIIVSALSKAANSLTQTLEKNSTDTKSAKLLLKQKNKEALSPEILAEELTDLGVTEHIRHYVLTYYDIPTFLKS
jgi:hypothetical protein